MDQKRDQAHKSDMLVFAGTEVNIVVSAAETEGAFSLLHVSNPSGCWTPPHLHRNEDETVFVLSGKLQVETEDFATEVGPGQALVLSRDRPHRLGNVGSTEARFLVLCTPGGFDDFVRDAGRPSHNDSLELTEADTFRLVQAAPRHGVELLAPDALRPAAFMALPAAAAEIDVLGVRIQIVAELGPEDDDLCLIRGQVPPGGIVPLHSHADRELLYGLDGALQVWAGEAVWRTVGVGDVMDISGGVPHALRNRSDVAADILLVTTRRIAGLFREIGRPTDTEPQGPPSHAMVEPFVSVSNSRGYWLAGEAENIALGLQTGCGRSP